MKGGKEGGREGGLTILAAASPMARESATKTWGQEREARVPCSSGSM
jgi:hypothetical protein